MLKCDNCGKDNVESADFCAKCGASISDNKTTSTKNKPTESPTHTTVAKGSIIPPPPPSDYKPPENFANKYDTGGKPNNRKKKKKGLQKSLYFVIIAIGIISIIYFGTSSFLNSLLDDTPSLDNLNIAQMSSDTDWYGLMTIYNYEGDTPETESDFDVWAHIGSDEDGDGIVLFEIYSEAEMSENSKIFSSFAEINATSLIPLIGDDDTFFYDTYLTQENKDDLKFHFIDGALVVEYAYNHNDVTFDSFVFMRRDGAIWDFTTDPTPPNYDTNYAY